MEVVLFAHFETNKNQSTSLGISSFPEDKFVLKLFLGPCSETLSYLLKIPDTSMIKEISIDQPLCPTLLHTTLSHKICNQNQTTLTNFHM